MYKPNKRPKKVNKKYSVIKLDYYHRNKERINRKKRIERLLNKLDRLLK